MRQPGSPEMRKLRAWVLMDLVQDTVDSKQLQGHLPGWSVPLSILHAQELRPTQGRPSLTWSRAHLGVKSPPRGDA